MYFPSLDFGVGTLFEMFGDSNGSMNGTCCSYVWISFSYFFFRALSSLFASRRYRKAKFSHAIQDIGLSLARVNPRVAVIIPRYCGCLILEYSPAVASPSLRLVKNWIAATRKMLIPIANRVHPTMRLRLTP